MCSFLRHLIIVHPIILRIICSKPMDLTPGFISLYGSVSSRLSSSVANCLAILAIILKSQLIVARSVLNYVSIHLLRGQMFHEVHEVHAFSCRLS